MKNYENLIEQDLQNAEAKKADINKKISSWIDIYEGAPLGNEVEGKSKIVWKLVKKHGETLVANLSKPFITGSSVIEAVPRTKYDEFKAKLDEKLVNFFFEKEFDKRTFIKTLSKVLTKEGTAFIRVGWERDIKINEATVSADLDSLEKFRKRGAKLISNEDGTTTIRNERVLTNRPTAFVCLNEDIFTDPDALDFEDSRFLIYRFKTTLEELEMNPEYDESVISKIKKYKEYSEDYNPDDLHDRSTLKNDEIDEPYVYEYWTKENGTIKCINFVNIGGIKILSKKDFPYAWFPFISIPFYDNEFDIWGNALAAIIEDEQKFMTSIVRGVIDNMSKSNNGTMFIKKGSVDPTNFRRLMTGSPVVEIKTNVPLSQAIHDGSFNELPSSVYNMLQVIESQAEGLTGVNRFMQGIGGNELNSPAGNFSAMMTQSQIRLLDITNNVAHGLKKMFVMWIEMIMDYLSDEEVYKITGTSLPEEKAKLTKRISIEYGIEQLPPDVQQKAMALVIAEVNDRLNKNDSKYDININIGTDGLKTVKVNQINMLMQQASGLVQAGVVPPDIMKELFADMCDLMDFHETASKARSFNPKPSPQEQAAIQVQLASEAAKAKKEEALAANAIARTEATKVKAQKELASMKADVINKYADAVTKLNQNNTEES